VLGTAARFFFNGERLIVLGAPITGAVFDAFDLRATAESAMVGSSFSFSGGNFI
jgi:hypothetical protein